MKMAASRSPTVRTYFVDEAGDGNLFGKRGRVIVGNEGCSRFFIVGLADIPDPNALGRDLNDLRVQLLADPYFRRVQHHFLQTGQVGSDRGSLCGAASGPAQVWPAMGHCQRGSDPCAPRIAAQEPRVAGGGLLSVGIATPLRATRGAIRSPAVVEIQPGARPGRYAPGSIRGLLHKEKAADISGSWRLAGDIGSLDRSRKITRHGAEFHPQSTIL